MLNYFKIFSRTCGFKPHQNSLAQCFRALSSSSSKYSQGAPVTPVPEITEKYPHLKTHKDIYDFSLENPSEFWGEIAKSYLQWMEPFHTVSNCDLPNGKISWFEGGKLNASVNCVDRHMRSIPDQTALIWERDEPGTEQRITYRQLYDQVGRLASALLQHGVRRGDRVAIYMPTSPAAAVAMLACARIGAVHSVVFAGFSAQALASRVLDAGAETIITSDQAVRGGKVIELKRIVDDAVRECPSVKRVFVATRTGAEVPRSGIDIPMEEAMEAAPAECEPAAMDAEDFLYMLYTSGSTGKPKGLVHSVAGYLLYCMFTQKQVFDLRPGDVFGCVADIGWITGHSHVVYGPLATGGTAIMFESTPVYPDPGRYWEMVQRLRPTHFYGAPTALRLLLKHGDSWVTKYDRSSLRVLGCVGEPLNHEAWQWYNDVVGDKRCSVIDTWWQTETGGVCLAPRPSAEGAEIRPGMPMRPMYGIEPVLLDEKNNEISGEDVMGALCLKRPWPGMARTIYGSHQRYVETYLKPMPGYYFTGDGAHRHPGGYYQITGRMDDVINVTGHRLGTAEVEDVMDEYEPVAETAVVGFPHELKGEGLYAFIIMKNDVTVTDQEVKDTLKGLIRNNIAGYAVPDHMLIVPGLPKTRSGKIMRRILRKIAANQPDDLGDISTLQDPSIVEQIVQLHRQQVQ
ncbi:acetyl-coenzyme A synthetase 2-like, mitochondrial isoform X1 [Amphibalanus amphitrite]|uniref:acetyl-coenzyme A synthetase 2-like, mitochondrial isoform X1 n=1 Tax=Amphibalanus amphitrite TaxID=1232801 RepID=UPI001C8FE40D|nr:acetyl-coenzyme A synthetase 2-like, mitochondrial isoform X1 [Amphibalanus amphitrite]